MSITDPCVADRSGALAGAKAVDHALVSANAVEHALASASHHARAVAKLGYNARVNDLSLRLDQARAHLLGLIQILETELDAERALYAARALARHLRDSLYGSRDDATSLDRALYFGLAHALRVGLGVDDRILASDHAGELVDAISNALISAKAADRALSHTAGTVRAPARPNRRIAPSATRLLGAATRVLPTIDRPRYAEEYLSELWELAEADTNRLGQLRYALRLSRSALSMSVALRSPRRRGVGQ